MVVTVGTSPVPVLLTICQHEPSAVWLVHSSGDRGTASHARRIAEVLGKHRPTMTVRLVDLAAEPGDFAAVRESLARPRIELDWPPRGPWRCDYTGGTAVMAVELVAAHLAAHGPSRAGWRSYWNEAGGQVRYDDGDHAPCRVPEFFDLVTVARLHGFAWRDVKGFRSLDIQDACWAESLCCLAHAVLAGSAEPDDPAGSSPVDAALVRKVRDSDKDSGKDSGDALELIVAALLARAGQLGDDLPRPDEVRVKFEVVPLDLHPGGDRVEIDVVARYGQRVLAVSCKNTSDALKNTAAAVGKVYQEAQALFGGATRRVLVTALAKSDAGGSQPVEPGFTDLLLGPGLTWRSPYVLTEGDLRRMLGEVTASPRRSKRTPELSRMLQNRLGLGTAARRPDVVLRNEIGPFDVGLTLVTTLSGNALAMVASGRGLEVRHIAVLEGASRAGAGELRRAIGAADATIDRVPVDMSDVPELIRRITWVIDCCARAEHPVVIDITGGTKAVSVAGYLAANAADQADVRLCYSDIRTGLRRWRDGKPEPLATLDTSISIKGLLNLSCRIPGAVEFPPVDLNEFARSDYPSERLLAQVMRRLTDGAGAERILVRPKLFQPGESEQNRDWLPRCAVLIAGNRLIGLYAHGKLTSMGKDKGLGEAMFVDALVAALGGDIARSLFVTSQDRDRTLSTLESGRLRALVRRPFPPRVLCRADAEDVIHDDAKLVELVKWMTA